MDQLREVSQDRIQALLGVMENATITNSAGQRVRRTEDEMTRTREQLLYGLRAGTIPGNAVVEWRDNQGSLQANVIDFLFYAKAKAMDPQTGQKIVVESKKVPDGTWRVLY